MSDMIYLLAGICLGGAVSGALAWAVSKARHGSRAVSLESSLKEVRGQLEARVSEAAGLRAELDGMRSARAEAAARLEEAERGLQRQRELLEKMEQGLSETFKSASMDALTKNTEQFLKHAEKMLSDQKEMGSRELEGKKELIDQSVEGITKRLFEVQKRIEDIGKSNVESIETVSRSIKQHAEVTGQLSATAEGLRQTLASAKKRGEWGERMAEDVIRLAGMAEGINYIKQKTLDHSAGRPDYTFFLPNKLKINMDVKFPMDNYLNFLEAETDADRKRFRDELIKNVRIMMKSLASRDYINTSDHTVDYVLMFIPNEQVYGFINESDVTLMDEALRAKVILCSPFTLYAVLAVIRQAVENFSLEQTASEILKLLAEFNKQWANYKDRFQVLGTRLEQARKEYDSLDSTRTNQLERPLRKMEELRKQKAIPLDENLDLD
jgi:DNA recombination protein RmuC